MICVPILNNRRLCIWGDLNKIKLSFLSGLYCICERENPKVFTIGGNDTEFGGLNGRVNPSTSVFRRVTLI